jgi:hypothetical protein
MENTSMPVFKENQAEFYLSRGEGFHGPFRPSEIYEKLMSKQVSWVDHCYREKDGVWTRISDHPVFRDLQPQAPAPRPGPIPPPFHHGKVTLKWYLFQNETQTGPFDEAEIKRLLGTAQIGQGAFLWNETMSDWQAVEDVEVFREQVLKAALLESVKGADRRTAPRKPLVAQVYLTNQQDISTAICRDVSIGGMQVLTEQIPGQPGETIRLNVLPPADSGLPPFVAEGVIVRVLEDRKGFSFRFTRLSVEARQAIEEYVS